MSRVLEEHRVDLELAPILRRDLEARTAMERERTCVLAMKIRVQVMNLLITLSKATCVSCLVNGEVFTFFFLKKKKETNEAPIGQLLTETTISTTIRMYNFEGNPSTILRFDRPPN